ncbi:ABC transporter permease [Natronoglomus mannanivorans]|uniref:ABC transporter permease n=1 Tax=Natronoglomus mannanivorans TaxID=2979990 RepID=A0AAP3E371_9EURY|nr:ABC transporter permease [Halobacteria archaeon AArc-xg1-1]
MTGERDQHRNAGRRHLDERSLRERVTANPRPAIYWVAGLLALLALELGTIAGVTLEAGSWIGTRTTGIWERGGLSRAALLAVALVGLVGASGRLSAIDRFRVTAGAGVDAEGDSNSNESRVPNTPRAVDTAVIAALVGTVVVLAIWVGAAGLVRTVGQGTLTWIADLPTLTAREVISNEGYQTPDGTWHGTFLGLSPAVAWALRVVVIYAYALLWVGWVFVGYRWFRTHYRRVEWTPRDDVVDRLRRHRWAQFGMVVVFVFLVMALFAPVLGPTTAEADLYGPYSHTFEYYDQGSGSVEELTVGEANLETRSVGYEAENVGPMSYDEYDRFHPFGTMPDGSDLFTFLVAGARISLVIGLLSVGLSGALATVFALISAYYRGLADLVLVVTGDTVMGVPRLLLLILLTVLLADTWLGGLYDGGILLAVVLAVTGWPYLWRSFRGPALQIAEAEWIDAARGFGQSTTVIMRTHMLPYLVGYLLIYCSMVLGGVILAVAGLSFLGLGITAPTPEWGRAVNLGQDYIATTSWHISLIPGLMITLVVTGFNALGDGIRDAIDPKADDSSSDNASNARGGGV